MVFIGIGGGTCSGKTTLARALSERLGDRCASLELDAYYRAHDIPFEERARLNHDLPEQFEWELLREHVAALCAGQPIEAPVYDFLTCNRTTEVRHVPPAPVIVLEGIHAFHDPAIREVMSLKIFMTATPEERRSRRLARDLVERCADPAFVIEKFERQTEVTYRTHVEPQRAFADHVCDSIKDALAIALAHIGARPE